MENIAKILEHYISTFNLEHASIPPAILNYFNVISEKYYLEDILQAINLSFEDLKKKKRAHPTEVIRTIQKNLDTIANIQHHLNPPKEQEIKSENIEEEKKITSNKADESHHTGNWKRFFEENDIPKDLINKKELEKIPVDLRDFYISAIVCDYLYSILPEKEREQINNLVEKKIKKLNISQKEKEKVKHLLVRHFTKKLYNIPY